MKGTQSPDMAIPGLSISAIRLDSGDLGELAKESRKLLDDAGMSDIGIFASGGLDEYKIRDLLADNAPITGFGVGSAMGVSEDAPVLDSAYKLCGYAGEGRMKLSPNKSNLPGRKQLYRVGEGTDDAHDVIARHDESIDGRPLLVKVMERGKRTDAGRDTLDAARNRATDELGRLPRRLRDLDPADPPYRVEISPQLQRDRDSLS
jgi:nicotinate phosphoribosyltransferase